MTDTKKTTPKDVQQPASDTVTLESTTAEAEPEEYGGPKGLEPTRYGDWERKGILSDF
jgi:hypothetical protein